LGWKASAPKRPWLFAAPAGLLRELPDTSRPRTLIAYRHIEGESHPFNPLPESVGSLARARVGDRAGFRIER